MTNITSTKEPTEQNAKRKETLFVADLEMRDWFAGKAMQGLWANATALAQMPTGAEAESIAPLAYQYADAMLKERSK